VQSFDFKLPDGVFKPDGVVAIKLTNEAHGAAGSKDDRELFVESVAINGDPLPGRALTMKSPAGVEPTAMLGDYLVVSQAAVEGIASAPAGGWPKAKADVASSAAKPGPGKPAETASAVPATAAAPTVVSPAAAGGGAAAVTVAVPAAGKPTDTASVATGASTTAATDGKPAETAHVPASAAAAPAASEKRVEAATAAIAPPLPAAQSAHESPAGAAADGIETGAITPAGKPGPAGPKIAMSADDSDSPDANPDPEANEPACGISKSFQITGFNENSNDLTPRTHRQLDVVAKTIGTQRCVVHLTGYSSTEGDYAHNALFSIERAQNALHYLSAAGVKFRRFSANGVGETTQFGPDPNANRRVVVVVSP
jgi:outer membrane protein OmpA-like peptidoglycan-associated protein